MVTRSDFSMRRIISDTAGRETSSRSAMRAWMTSTSSSRSSKMASQYSSNAGCHSLVLMRCHGRGVYGVRPPEAPGERVVHTVGSLHGVHRARPARTLLGAGPRLVLDHLRRGHRRRRPRAGRPSPSGDHTLVLAPTGSGKTLAAFLWGLDRLVSSPPPDDREHRTRLIYVSPLRALAVDVEKNLRAPLRRHRRWPPSGSASRSTRRSSACAPATPPPTSAARMLRNPPDLLITTPESLYLMLTSQARENLRGVEAVIIDEIHALAPTKRGAHLVAHPRAPRRQSPTGPSSASGCRPPSARSTRSPGSSAATTAPTGHAPAGHHRRRRRAQAARHRGRGAGRGHGRARRGHRRAGQRPRRPAGPVRRSIWPSMHPRLLELVEEHRSTIIFVNARRLAERLATRLNELHLEGREPRRPRPTGTLARAPADELVMAHHGSLSRERRLFIEDQLKRGELKGLVATSLARARHRHGRRRPRRPGRVARRGEPRASSASAGPATRWASPAGASSSRSTATTSSRRRSWSTA